MKFVYLSVVTSLSLLLILPQVRAQGDAPMQPGASTGGATSNESALKKIDELPIPSVEELLTKAPVDWIVLKAPRRDEVLIVQPVSPRPDTITRMAKAADELRQAAKRPKQEAGESADQYRQRLRDLMDEAENLLVLFPLIEGVKAEDQDSKEYRLNVSKNIDRIVYHEDLMLKRADLLMTEGNLSQAFELLLVLERRAGEWPGYIERRNRLLFEEGRRQRASGNAEAAYGYFEELHLSSPKYDGLYPAIGDAADLLIQNAIDSKNSMQARFYLARLRQKEPDHPIVVKWVNYFVGQVDQLLLKAKVARDAGRHAEAIQLADEGARIWPSHPTLKSTHNTLAKRHQTLHVGVLHPLPATAPYSIRAESTQRELELTSVELFEVSQANRTPVYNSRFIEEWTPFDLGRQIIFQLKPRRSTWEASSLVTATQVAQGIGERIQSGSPHFDERLKSYVQSVSVKSPYEFVIHLSRSPVRPQTLLRFPLIAKAEMSDGETPVGSANVISRRFVVADRSEQRSVYLRDVPEPDTSPQFHVAEVVEHYYSNAEQQLQALMRGEIGMLPRPPIWLVDRIARSDMFTIEPYAIPSSYVLQFNPQSEVLKNNEIRRAMAYSINRERLLKEIVFKDEKVTRGRLTTAPFSQKSYAYNPEVQNHPFDLPMAFALTSVGKRKFNGVVPPMTLICEPDEVSIKCCQELVKEWAKIGLTIKLVTDPAKEVIESWDIAYRSVQMPEPLTEIWPFLTVATNSQVQSLENVPDWLRQSLIELDQAADMTNATDQLRQLHLKLHDFVQYIPLWEIDDVMVYRKHIQGVPKTPLTTYQNVERWIIQPWYPVELIGEST